MASLLVRNISDETKRALRIKAAENGRSMSEEARRLIEIATLKSTAPKPNTKASWVEEVMEKMRSLGEAELEIPPRLPGPPPPDFSGPEFG